MSVLRTELKRLTKGSVFYVLPPVLARVLSFLLTPLYTQVMSPAEFGDVSIAASLTILVATVMTFGTHLSITRLHFQFDDDVERKRFYGTLLTFLVIAPAVIAGALHLVGALGGLDVLRHIPFEPHLVLVIWAAYFMCFGNVPTNIYAVREEPRTAAFFSALLPVSSAVGGVLFVVVLEQGAVGYLRGAFWAALVTAVIGVAFAFRVYRPRWSWAHLRAALAFGAPLVPMLLSTWALSLSDRLILERFVSRAELGVYGLGYSFAMIVTIVNGAVDRAFLPMLNRKLSRNEAPEDVPRIGSYVLALMTWAALSIALGAREAVELLTPESYHAAPDIVVIVAFGMLFQGLAHLLAQGIFYAKKTLILPLTTGLAAALNIGLNLWLVPRFGIIAAAATTLAAYAFQALLHGIVAERIRPIGWEYARWLRLFVAAVVVFAASYALGDAPYAARLSYKLALALVAFPLLLRVTGFVSGAEVAAIRKRALAFVRR
jgi:O-antigen/teichoic acid export membrane protein